MLHWQFCWWEQLASLSRFEQLLLADLLLHRPVRHSQCRHRFVGVEQKHLHFLWLQLLKAIGQICLRPHYLSIQG